MLPFMGHFVNQSAQYFGICFVGEDIWIEDNFVLGFTAFFFERVLDEKPLLTPAGRKLMTHLPSLRSNNLLLKN